MSENRFIVTIWVRGHVVGTDSFGWDEDPRDVERKLHEWGMSNKLVKDNVREFKRFKRRRQVERGSDVSRWICCLLMFWRKYRLFCFNIHQLVAFPRGQGLPLLDDYSRRDLQALPNQVARKKPSGYAPSSTPFRLRPRRCRASYV